MTIDAINQILFLGAKITFVVFPIVILLDRSRNTSAANLHHLVLITLLGLLVIPAVYFLLPNVAVEVLTGPLEATLHWHTPPSSALQWILMIILMVYCVGVCIKCAQLVAGLLKLKSLVEQAQPITDLNVATQLMDAKSALGISCSIQVVQHNSIKMPMTWGVQQIYVGLPANYQQWPVAQLKRILLHELAHVKRKDAVVNIIISMVEAVLWCIPSVSLLTKKIHWYRELACDDMVLAQGIDRTDYAQDLLDFTQARTQPVGHAVALIDASENFNRIHAILDNTRVHVNNRIQWPIYTAVLMVVFGLLGSLSLEVIQTEKATRIVIWPMAAVNEQAQKKATNANPKESSGAQTPSLISDSSVQGWLNTEVSNHQWVQENVKTLSIHDEKIDFSIERSALNLTAVDYSVPLQLINAVTPEYPKKALLRGYEGEVEVVFDILPSGLTDNIRIAKADKKGLFIQPVLNATQQYVYQPRWVNGKPVKTENVKEVFKFQIFEDAK